MFPLRVSASCDLFPLGIRKLNQLLKFYITFEDSLPFLQLYSLQPECEHWMVLCPFPSPLVLPRSASWWLHSSDRADVPPAGLLGWVGLVGASFTQHYKKASRKDWVQQKLWGSSFWSLCGCWKETLFFLLRLRYLNCKIILLLLFKLVFR